jgi:hypothetical protein
MTEYAILLNADESQWANATPEHIAAMYAKHNEFAATLAERGHKMTGGAELGPSGKAVVVRDGSDGVTVTDGPFAETVEQLGGFYTVETDDLDGLLELVGILAGTGAAVEVRACVDHSGDAPS